MWACLYLVTQVMLLLVYVLNVAVKYISPFHSLRLHMINFTEQATSFSASITEQLRGAWIRD